METLTFFISLALAAGLWILYRRMFGVVYLAFGAMFRDFGVCFIIGFMIVNAAGSFVSGAISGIGSFLGFVLSGLLKIALVAVVVFVALGVIGVILKKCGIIKDEPKEVAVSGEEGTAPVEEGAASEFDQAQGQDTTE